MTLFDSQDNEMFTSSQIMSQSGTLVFTYKIKKNMPGGIYKIKVSGWGVLESVRLVRINQE